MQPSSRDQVSSSLRKRRTQPALPAATLPTAPIVAHSRPDTIELFEPKSPPKKLPRPGRRALLQLLLIGVISEVLFLALYPLLAGATAASNVAKQALTGLFPWLPQLYWTTKLPFLGHLLANIPLFDPANAGGGTHLLFLLLALSFLLTLLTGRIGNRVGKEKLSPNDIRMLFYTIFIFAAIFGVTYLFAPAVFSQDIFLYGTYGRLVTVYHVNPYAVSLNAFPHDLLHQGLFKDTRGHLPPGPIWIDFSLPVVLLARESMANILLGFRIVGLIAHLINAMLLWFILVKLKPATRISATLLYAWNPLVLLLSVYDMHLEVVLLLLLLLAIFFFQRKSLLLAWVFVLLAALINIICLLLLPLFFRLLSKEKQILSTGHRVLWWLTVFSLSGLIIVLAYVPYWQGWGLNGLLGSLGQSFLQDTAINSLDAALLKLPITPPPALAWLLMSQHWTIFAAVAVACILLLGLWLADTVELVVLFNSWLLLALLMLLPVYWPEYALLPLALALCSANGRTILLALLLTMGALGSWYFWLWQPVWVELALITVGLPLLIWGWILFFSATWAMIHPDELEPAAKQPLRRGLSRPSLPDRSWPSRSSWPVRRR
ncbi:MAG: hypothetical protein NVS4B7_02200 [Ktedonobacteraceae bacterium]